MEVYEFDDKNTKDPGRKLSDDEITKLLTNTLSNKNYGIQQIITEDLIEIAHSLSTHHSLIELYLNAGMGAYNIASIALSKAVYDNQIKRGKRCLIVDSNLFLYKDKTNAKGYLRYS